MTVVANLRAEFGAPEHIQSYTTIRRLPIYRKKYIFLYIEFDIKQNNNLTDKIQRLQQTEEIPEW